MKAFNFLLVMIGSMPFACANAYVDEWDSQHAVIMGTNIRIEAYAKELVKYQGCVDAVFADLHTLDQLMSPYKDTSDIARINAAKGRAVKVSGQTYDVIKRSLYYSAKTAGVFDISFASLGVEYDYKKKQKPSEQRIQVLLPKINYRAIELLEDNRVRVPAGTKVDVGGIAKGYGVDRSLETLKACGLTAALVAAGGDMKMYGEINGSPMVVGIKNPRSRSEPLIRVPLTNVAISTSGDYERFYMSGDERIHHIINPQTGKPSYQSQSVTVLCQRSMDCDALSTSLFIMGVKRGLAFINSLDGYDAIMIDSAGKLHFSAGLLMGR